jgi:hypothetical protein
MLICKLVFFFLCDHVMTKQPTHYMVEVRSHTNTMVGD